jgi:RNA polymerase sigma-70 factor, ECF subfamily
LNLGAVGMGEAKGETADFEATLRSLHEAHNFDAVATLALRRYGPEVLGFLVAVRRDAQAASEAFSQFCEDLWVGLPNFAWGCTLRTWAYALARHALARHGRDAFRRRGVPLSNHPQLSALEQQVRTETLPHLRTDAKGLAARLREQLEPDEQALLVLRIDRNLSWHDVALVLSERGPREAPTDLAKEAAALRKRFERVKAKLKALMAREGAGGD